MENLFHNCRSVSSLPNLSKFPNDNIKEIDLSKCFLLLNNPSL